MKLCGNSYQSMTVCTWGFVCRLDELTCVNLSFINLGDIVDSTLDLSNLYYMYFKKYLRHTYEIW